MSFYVASKKIHYNYMVINTLSSMTSQIFHSHTIVVDLRSIANQISEKFFKTTKKCLSNYNRLKINGALNLELKIKLKIEGMLHLVKKGDGIMESCWSIFVVFPPACRLISNFRGTQDEQWTLVHNSTLASTTDILCAVHSCNACLCKDVCGSE